MPALWEGYFLGDKSDVLAALEACPRLRDDLRRVGWDESRARPISSEHISLADEAFYHPHPYAEAFLDSFGGIELLGVMMGDAPSERRRLSFYIDKSVESILGASDYYVMQLIGQTTPFPVAMVDDFVLFVEHTSQQSVLIESEFRSCYRAKNPFKLLEYAFYKTKESSVVAVQLRELDVPSEFRSRFKFGLEYDKG